MKYLCLIVEAFDVKTDFLDHSYSIANYNINELLKVFKLQRKEDFRGSFNINKKESHYFTEKYIIPFNYSLFNYYSGIRVTDTKPSQETVEYRKEEYEPGEIEEIIAGRVK